MAKNKLDYSAMYRGDNPKISTGILPLDIVTDGGIVRGDLIGITAAEGVGKCMTKDTVIYTADGLRRMGDLVEIPGLVNEGTSVYSDVSPLVNDVCHSSTKLYHKGIAKVYKLTTALGHSFTCTKEHQVMMEDGTFKPLEEISVRKDKVRLNHANYSSIVCTNDNGAPIPISMGKNHPVVYINDIEAYAMGFLLANVAVSASNFSHGTHYAFIRISPVAPTQILIDVWKALGADILLSTDSLVKIAYESRSFLGGLLNRFERDTAKVPWFIWKSCFQVQRSFLLGFLEVPLIKKDGQDEYIVNTSVLETIKNASFESYAIARFAKNLLQVHSSEYMIYHREGCWNITHDKNKNETDLVTSIRFVGLEEVYDIQDVDCDCFVADGVIVHNSTTMMQLCKNRIAQGLKVAYLDIETGFTSEVLENSYHVKEYHSTTIGENQLFLVSPSTWAEVDEICARILESEVYSDVIIDSISSIVSSGTSTKNIEQSWAIGEDARLQTLFLKKYKSKFRNQGVTLWALNQVRANINITGAPMAFGASPTKAYGGRALKHAADVLITMTAGEPIKQSGIATVNKDDKDVQIGNKAWIKADKNRRAMPKIKVMMPILFGKGVSNQMSLFDILIKSTFLTQTSPGRYVLSGFEDQKFTGKNNVFSYIREKYTELLPWCESKGIVSLIQEGIKEGDEIESVDSTEDGE